MRQEKKLILLNFLLISDKESKKIKFFSLKDLFGSEAEQHRKERKA